MEKKNNGVRIFAVLLIFISFGLIGYGIYLNITNNLENSNVNSEDVDSDLSGDIIERITTAYNLINELDSVVIDYDMLIGYSIAPGEMISITDISGNMMVDNVNDITYHLGEMTSSDGTYEVEFYTFMKNGEEVNYINNATDGWIEAEDLNIEISDSADLLLSLINENEVSIVEKNGVTIVTAMIDPSALGVVENDDMNFPLIFTLENDYLISLSLEVGTEESITNIKFNYSRFNEDLELELPLEIAE